MDDLEQLRKENADLREQLYVRGENMREMSDEFVRVLTVAMNTYVDVRKDLEEQRNAAKIEAAEARHEFAAAKVAVLETMLAAQKENSNDRHDH